MVLLSTRSRALVAVGSLYPEGLKPYLESICVPPSLSIASRPIPESAIRSTENRVAGTGASFTHDASSFES